MARKSSTRPGCGGKPHVSEDHLDSTQARLSLLLAHVSICCRTVCFNIVYFADKRIRQKVPLYEQYTTVRCGVHNVQRHFLADSFIMCLDSLRLYINPIHTYLLTRLLFRVVARNPLHVHVGLLHPLLPPRK